MARNWPFWSFWARPCRLIWCPVGGLVGGCGARAVSRKTPIYFILVTGGHCYFGDHFVDDNHFSDQGKEGGGEVDSAVFIYWLVHPKIQLI